MVIFGKFQVFKTKRPSLKDFEVPQEHAVLDSDLTRNVYLTSMISLAAVICHILYLIYYT